MANRRTSRSLAVNAPSLNTGWVNRFVVIIGTFIPVSSSASWNRSRCLVRSSASLPKGTTSSSWKVTPYAPSSLSRCTDSTGSSGGRDASPKGSRACQPTVHRPNVNLCSGRGVSESVPDAMALLYYETSPAGTAAVTQNDPHGPQPAVDATRRSAVHAALDPTVQTRPDSDRRPPSHRRSRGEGAQRRQRADRPPSRGHRSGDDPRLRCAVPRGLVGQAARRGFPRP